MRPLAVPIAYPCLFVCLWKRLLSLCSLLKEKTPIRQQGQANWSPSWLHPLQAQTEWRPFSKYSCCFPPPLLTHTHTYRTYSKVLFLCALHNFLQCRMQNFIPSLENVRSLAGRGGEVRTKQETPSLRMVGGFSATSTQSVLRNMRLVVICISQTRRTTSIHMACRDGVDLFFPSWCHVPQSRKAQHELL